MTTFIPRQPNPQAAARIREHAMGWYASGGKVAAAMKRPVKVRLITNPAAMVAYVKSAVRAAVDTRQRYGDDTRR
ncbi:hypothetical protein ACGFIY_21285 [Micromonospora chersina]|uniref:hypothetical protein n=1 Tax=Micromonospora chersina TaxID=47854 RepID=UPI00371496E9